RVINGTGVLIHTNLGRSPLGAKAVEKVAEIAGGYSNLEFDLNTGERGRRGAFLERCLALQCGAEAATAVNNCAAALVLMLRELAPASRPEVVISRGELIEIGGGFRIPEILESSGACLKEVGTTNRTKIEDFAKAIGSATGILMKVHRSNFYQEGFVEEPSLEDLVSLGREHRIPVVLDLGSGALVSTEELAAIPHEEMITEALRAGVDLVCISGDKLLGGPQAGVIAGREDLIRRLKKNPLFRALRCDKMIFAALEESVMTYLEASEKPDLRLLKMLGESCDALKERAVAIVEQLATLKVECGEGVSRCGGGTMPKAEIPSITLDIRLKSIGLSVAAKQLRMRKTPVVAYVSDDCLKIDLRTVSPEQDGEVVEALKDLLGESG
ncbi:MAG: L-seryl-tRNA(Sec) selenium transferase, partial [Verrucomicrobiota bacterium]